MPIEQGRASAFIKTQVGTQFLTAGSPTGSTCAFVDNTGKATSCGISNHRQCACVTVTSCHTSNRFIGDQNSKENNTMKTQECQSNSHQCHYTPAGMVKQVQKKMPSVGEQVEQQRCTHYWWACKMAKPLWRQHGRMLQKSNIPATQQFRSQDLPKRDEVATTHALACEHSQQHCP